MLRAHVAFAGRCGDSILLKVPTGRDVLGKICFARTNRLSLTSTVTVTLRLFIEQLLLCTLHRDHVTIRHSA